MRRLDPSVTWRSLRNGSSFLTNPHDSTKAGETSTWSISTRQLALRSEKRAQLFGPVASTRNSHRQSAGVAFGDGSGTCTSGAGLRPGRSLEPIWGICDGPFFARAANRVDHVILAGAELAPDSGHPGWRVSFDRLGMRLNSGPTKGMGMDWPAVACPERSLGPDPAGTGSWCNGDIGLIAS